MILTYTPELSLFLLYRTRSSFFHSTRSQYATITTGDAEDGQVDGRNDHVDGGRGRIEGAYRDDPEAGADDGSSGDTARNATDNAHGPVVQPSGLRHEGNGWGE